MTSDSGHQATPPDVSDCACCGNPLANAYPEPVDECYCSATCREYDALIGGAMSADWFRERGENPAYGSGNPDWERDFERTADVG